MELHNFALLMPITTSLAWAVAFGPPRLYLQQLIERRFNVRDREEAKLVEDFTGTLRQEIDLDQLCDRFLAVIQRTLHPYSASLWIRTKKTPGDLSETPEAIEVADGDPLLARALRHPGV